MLTPSITQPEPRSERIDHRQPGVAQRALQPDITVRSTGCGLLRAHCSQRESESEKPMSVLSILEDVLQTHPAVAHAAVVASPDEPLGEVPKAFIVPRRPASARELIAWVADQVAPYPRIRRVEFVERLPGSPDGKILDGLLAARERAAFASSDATGSLPLPLPQRSTSDPLAA
jgi:hypothetical protein